MRRCVGCNEHKPKAELLRVVRDPEGGVSLDFKGKKADVVHISAVTLSA